MSLKENLNVLEKNSEKYKTFSVPVKDENSDEENSSEDSSIFLRIWKNGKLSRTQTKTWKKAHERSQNLSEEEKD